MAPQATLVVPTPTASAAVSTNAAARPGRKPFVPELLLIFLGVCLAYTLSYVLYRIVMARRRASHQDNPDTPDRGVSRFMSMSPLFAYQMMSVLSSFQMALASPSILVTSLLPRRQIRTSHPMCVSSISTVDSLLSSPHI